MNIEFKHKVPKPPTKPKIIPIETMREVQWPYEQYYIGSRDKDQRKHGEGENNWTGAESIERYTGPWVRDTMNGKGDYRWRYRGKEHEFFTYEGQFFVNTMHGYGIMSYPDGTIFTGLYSSNIRWGPGIETLLGQKKLYANVGLWRKNQLIKLAWRPPVPCYTIDLMAGDTWKTVVEPHRTVLKSDFRTVGSTNSAMELLKLYGAQPVKVTEIWHKLYVENCTDMENAACYEEAFERAYYNGNIDYLEECNHINPSSETNLDTKEADLFFTWNNNPLMVHMMKHCYKHEMHRHSVKLAIKDILNGNRRIFSTPGIHEANCRSLLMASYLGRTNEVTILINEQNVHPDVADVRGNTPLIYATCGDRSVIIHFLVEAGANVNTYNDACCTPLGIALMRLACIQKDVPHNGFLDALLPNKTMVEPNPQSQNILEWHINRDLSAVPTTTTQQETSSLHDSSKKRTSKSITKLKPSKLAFPHAAITATKPPNDYDSDDDKPASLIKDEYLRLVNLLFVGPKLGVQYIFVIEPIVIPAKLGTEVKTFTSEKKLKTKEQEKAPVLSTDFLLWHRGNEDHYNSPADSMDKFKAERFAIVMVTILQLLEDGADPKLVKCPFPALFMALFSESSELVDSVLKHGAAVNERFPQAHNYTALDIIISLPFNYNNLKIIKVLLHQGADVSHRIPYQEDPGPTLLHYVVMKQREFEYEEDIMRHIVDLLLTYGCDSNAFFREQSTVDLVMSHYPELLSLFVKHPKQDLNTIINSKNQTILAKFFTLEFIDYTIRADMDRMKMINDILLYGADPLMECEVEGKKYKNTVELARKTIAEHHVPKETKPQPGAKQGSKGKVKEDTKHKKDTAKIKVTHSAHHNKAKLVSEFEQSIQQVEDAIRIMHVRWLQTKLFKELLGVVIKYKYSPWVMILKKHTNQYAVMFWLTPRRCLDIWDILKNTRRKMYQDVQVLKFLLYIVHFYNRNANFYPTIPAMTGIEKRTVEAEVTKILKEHKVFERLNDDLPQLFSWPNFSIKPELSVHADQKFDICFECAMPFDMKRIPCTICQKVDFCSCRCLEINMKRNCHPCDRYLKEYYPCEDPSLGEAGQ